MVLVNGLNDIEVTKLRMKEFIQEIIFMPIDIVINHCTMTSSM